MRKLPNLLLTLLVICTGCEVFAQGSAPAPAAAQSDRANRPGATSQIAPTPGPATSPALPSPQMPAATVQNREQAAAAKAAKRAAKKSKASTRSKTATPPPNKSDAGNSAAPPAGKAEGTTSK